MFDTTSFVQVYSTPMTVRRIVDRLRGIVRSPEVPETIEEAADRRRTTREAAKLKLTRIAAQRAAELPKLAAAEEKAFAEFERIRPGYEAARRALAEARAEHLRRAHDTSYASMLSEREIMGAAEPIIQATIAELRDLLQSNRETKVEYSERDEKWSLDGVRHYTIWSNCEVLNRRRQAILAAIDEAEAMKADPDQDDMAERLAALVEALPDPHTMEKVATR